MLLTKVLIVARFDNSFAKCGVHFFWSMMKLKLRRTMYSSYWWRKRKWSLKWGLCQVIALQSSSLLFQKYGLKIDNIKLTLVKGIPKLGIRIMKLKLRRTIYSSYWWRKRKWSLKWGLCQVMFLTKIFIMAWLDNSFAKFKFIFFRCMA